MLGECQFSYGIYDQARTWYLRAYQYENEINIKAHLLTYYGLCGFYDDKFWFDLTNIKDNINSIIAKWTVPEDKYALWLLAAIDAIKSLKFELAFRYISKIEKYTMNLSAILSHK